MPVRWLLASLAARRARLALSLLAITVGITVATALATLALRIGDDVARALRAAGPNFVVLPAGARWSADVGGAEISAPRAGLVLRDTAVAGLKRSFWRNNVLQAAPEIAVRASLAGRPVTVVGTWFDRDVVAGDEHWRTGLAALRPTWQVNGRWPSGDAAEIALGATLARKLELAPGRHVELALGDRSGRWLVTAVVAAGGRDDELAWAPLARVQRLAGREGEVDRVWLSALVRPAPPGPPPDPVRDPEGYERYMCAAYPANVAKDLAGRLGADVVPASDAVAGEALVVGRLHLLMLLLALAALSASVLGLFSTTAATVVERRVELGLLRALGASPRQVATLLFGETLLVAIGGGAAGWLVGSLAAGAIRGRIFGAGPAVEPLLLPLSVALAIAVAALGTIGPLRTALRLDPATVLRG